MVLAKLMIFAEIKAGIFGVPMPVLFNPNQLTIRKTASWRDVEKGEQDVPGAQFTGGDPATLSLELFFDTYESGVDVRTRTLPIFHLATVQKHGDMHRPPVCRLQWGLYDFDGFQWVLESVEQTFTLFLEVGIPVRATLACSFKQWRAGYIENRLLNLMSADVPKTHVVKTGDSLSTIAAQEYQDPALWRAIAAANNLDNPLALSPGQVLKIPPLARRRSAQA